MISLIQHFEADFLWKSKPQNPEFRNNPENFHPGNVRINNNRIPTIDQTVAKVKEGVS